MADVSSFKDRVVQIIQKIPRGKVTTYGTVAALASLPRGARLVGGILHHCTEDLNLPWQRVVNREGYISTRCLEHPKAAQKALLLQEGIEVSDDFISRSLKTKFSKRCFQTSFIVNLEKYGWFG